MKILILSQFAGSAHHGMVLRNYNWAIELKKMGHDVTIMASSYSHVRVKQPDVQNRLETENIDGIRYIWIKDIAPFHSDNMVARLRSMILFSFRSFMIARRHKRQYDIVVASSPQPLVIYAARRLAQKFSAKLVFDIRDLWPLSITELSKISTRNPIIWLLQQAEDYACRHADLVTAVPNNCEDYLKDHGLADGKFLHIPNGLMLDDQQDSPAAAVSHLPAEHESLFQRIKGGKNIVFGYTGSMGKANVIEEFLHALKKCPSHFHTVLIGKGPSKDSLMRLAFDLQINDRVHFLPAVEASQVQSVLAHIDVAYIGLKNKKLYEYGASPTKLNDYMLAARPILYSGADPLNAVEKSEGGICCAPENIDDIAAAMMRFGEMDKKSRDAMGQRGKAWLLENNLVSGHMQQMLEALEMTPLASE